jgi:PIN domain nuclease of toxin-antitoxin system
MRLLLDTHVAIWALIRPARLGETGRTLVADPGNEVFVSVVSVWEIAIKHVLGARGGALPFSGARAIELFAQAGYRMLEVRAEHAVTTETLPRLHGNPFDRLLVAQALAEPMRLVTADAMVARYSDMIIKVP